MDPIFSHSRDPNRVPRIFMRILAKFAILSQGLENQFYNSIHFQHRVGALLRKSNLTQELSDWQPASGKRWPSNEQQVATKQPTNDRNEKHQGQPLPLDMNCFANKRLRTCQYLNELKDSSRVMMAGVFGDRRLVEEHCSGVGIDSELQR